MAEQLERVVVSEVDVVQHQAQRPRAGVRLEERAEDRGERAARLLRVLP